MRTFVTGVDGFIGRWLTDLLVLRGDIVSGMSRAPAGRGGVQYFVGDVRDAGAVAAAIQKSRPDRVFHLAAWNDVRGSFTHPEETVHVNVKGSLAVIAAMCEHAEGATLVSVGSSSEYGDSTKAKDLVTEDDPLLPTSPYGISKAAQGMFVRQMHRSRGLRAMHVRPFAIIGPGKRGDALSHFAERVVRIEEGEDRQLLIGSLTSVRDFMDVRDCALALVLLSEKGEPGGVYNICTGKPAPVSILVDLLRASAVRPFETAVDPALVRPVDDLRIVGDARRLGALGFAPCYTLAQAVKDTLDHFRASGRAT